MLSKAVASLVRNDDASAYVRCKALYDEQRAGKREGDNYNVFKGLVFTLHRLDFCD